jgi:hypothetical protein
MPPVTLFVRSFKDGVGRQAPSKRLPTEAQDLINTVVTVERSAEKRPGTIATTCTELDGTTITTYGDLELPASADDMFHYWFDLTPSAVYLISVDYKGAGDLIYIHEVVHNGGTPTIRKITSIAGSTSIRDYARQGNGTYEAKEALEMISLGPTLLLLNKAVATGYTSDADGFEFDINGAVTAVPDPIGAPVSYTSASATDPEGTALIWVENRAYVGGQEVYRPSDGVSGTIYRANDDISASANTAAAYGTAIWTDTGRDMALVPVKDFDYPDSSKAYLGQSLNDISELNLPPAADDVLAANGAEAMLAALYPDDLGDNQNGRGAADGGKGKVYYLQNGYGGTEPGYYIVRSATVSPYLKKIRTPEAFSLIDNERMPVVITPSNGATVWTAEHGSYDERISGDSGSNPGPKAWEDGTQAPITAMATFRNRLWYAIGDTVFSSKVDDFGNFFLEDPALIVDTDPIDVSLSSNKYTPVLSLTPFESYIFVNTGADVQFALEGSENQITPYTAALSSESFYSTAPATEPVLMGNQVYFFDDRRLYIYMPSSAVTVQRAAEVSKNVPNYLPVNYGAITVCNAYETMFMTDNDNRKDVYCYTNRFQGDQLLQNAFFKMEYSEDISALHTHEEEIYFLTKNADNRYSFRAQRFREDVPEKIFMDSQERLVIDGTNRVYDPNTNTSTITFTGTVDVDNDTLIVDYDSTDDVYVGGVIQTLTNVDRTVPGSVAVSIRGNVPDGVPVVWGKNYNMRITLSPTYQRDQQNNVIDGLLSLRSVHTRHANSGSYSIEKTVRGRTSTPTTFTPLELDETLGLDNLPLSNVEVTGEAIAKIFGNSDNTSISIVSDSPSPVNITQIQLKGIFNEKYSSFNR